jgi:heme/copper-type cytochrome/quinol oxidase subunit 3
MMEIRQIPAIDVSHLPTSAFGHKEPLWWGVMLAIAIESTAFALTWSTYLYLRMQEATWPPWRWSAPDLLVGSISTVVLFATWFPMYAMSKAARKMDAARIRKLLVIFFAICAVAGAIRIWEYIALQVKWDSNAYGSIVWALLTIHTVHFISSIAETGILAAYLFLRPMDPKHALDVEVSALYWYFVVGSWIPNFILLYLGPHILN